MTQCSVENDTNSCVTREFFDFSRAKCFRLNTSQDRITSPTLYIALGYPIA